LRKDLESWIRGEAAQGSEAVIDAFSLRFPVTFFSTRTANDATSSIPRDFFSKISVSDKTEDEKIYTEIQAEPYEENKDEIAEVSDTAEEFDAEKIYAESLPEDGLEAKEQVEEHMVTPEREPDDYEPNDHKTPDENGEVNEMRHEEDEKRPAWKILQETMRAKRVKNTEQIYTAYKRRGFREDRVRFIAFCLLAVIILGTAIALYRNIQRGTYDAMMTKAQDLFAQEQYAAALSAFNEAALRHTDRIEPLLGAAHSAERAGRVDEAIAAYRLSLDRLPAGSAHLRSQTFYEIGRLYSVLREWGNAQESFEQAIAADVTNFNARFSLGNSLKEQGKLDEALLVYQQALSLSPSSAAAREAIDQVSLAMFAREEAERLAQLEERFQQAAQSGRAALEEERFREASDYFAEALAIRSNDASAWVGFGEARFRLGDTAGAVTSMERAIERDPEYERAKLRLAEIREIIEEQNRREAPQPRRQRRSSRSPARNIAPTAAVTQTAQISQADQRTQSRVALFDRGVELFHMGEYEASFNYFVASMRSSERGLLPQMSLAGFHGVARFGQGFQPRLNVPLEARLLAEAVQLNPLDRDLYINLAMAATKMGLDRQAMRSVLSEVHSHATRASS